MINIEVLKKMDRYEDFTYLDKPTNFKDYFKNKNYDVVQIHDIRYVNNNPREVWGFVGAFGWINNEIKSMDGDTYTPDMNMYGFDEFTYEEENKEKTGIEILVDEW